jgi:cell division protein ZapA
MDHLSIKIRIADRDYPMKVKSDDEEKVRNAGKLINEKLRSYREQFGIDDKQDLLAMVAFDSVVDKLETEKQEKETDDSVIQKINHLNHLVSQSL